MTQAPNPSTPELLPCPFCGQPGAMEHLESGQWSVGCSDDQECIGWLIGNSWARKIEAITAWNTRSQSTRIAELERALEQISAPIGNEPSIGDRGFHEGKRTLFWRRLAIRYREIAIAALSAKDTEPPVHKPFCGTCGKDVAEILCPTCAKWWDDNPPQPVGEEGLLSRLHDNLSGAPADAERAFVSLDDHRAILAAFQSQAADLARLKEQVAKATGTQPRYWTEWHEDMGPVLWWKWPVGEPPYVGSPLDLGFTVDVEVKANSSCGGFAGGNHRLHVGGWPFGDEDDERRNCLWWTPLPDGDELDRAIRDEIRGGPDPFDTTLQEISPSDGEDR